jgi:hypothetical protein
MPQKCYEFISQKLLCFWYFVTVSKNILNWYNYSELVFCMEVKILFWLHFASFTTHYTFIGTNLNMLHALNLLLKHYLHMFNMFDIDSNFCTLYKFWICFNFTWKKLHSVYVVSKLIMFRDSTDWAIHPRIPQGHKNH